ncbi:MAG: tetratricopeptide repeat protein [Candidatus Velthaea sp.]
MLVILDNCEHLLDECARVAEHLIHACGQLAILTTTREALRADGECAVRLEPMEVEDVRLDSPALALFVDRLGDADFERYAVLSADERATAAGICRRLDGIPLALELAAARAREFSLDAMLRGLDDRFALLSRGRRTASPRQQTLRGAIDWSYALLDPFERRVLARVGIFAGSFTPEAVDAVCGDASGDVRDALNSLIAKSLVTVVEDPGGRLRYRLLETMRAYALEALDEDDRRDGALRHARYFLEVATAADARRGRVGIQKIVAAVAPDLDNVREALTWSLGRREDPLLGAQLAGALGWAYAGMNLAAEGAGWCRDALARNAALPPAVAGRIHAALSFLLHYVGNTAEALAEAEHAVAAYEEAGDERELAWSLTQRAWCLVSVGRLDAAHDVARRAVGIARRHEDPGRLATALSNLAISIPPENAAARLAPLREAVACVRTLGPDTRGLVAISLARLGDAYYALGDYAAALASIDEALTIARQLGNRMVTASHLINVAAYSLACGRVAEARLAAREAIEILRYTDNRATVKYAVEHLAGVAARNGDAARGARLLGAANHFYAAAAMPRQFTEQTLYDATIVELERKLGAGALARLLDEGAAFSLEHALTEALAVQ